MKKTIITLAIAATTFAAFAFDKPKPAAAPADSADSTGTIVICHRSATRGAVLWQTLTIDSSQLSIHLAHGDYIGACN